MFNPSKQFDNLPQIPGQCVLYSRFLTNFIVIGTFHLSRLFTWMCIFLFIISCPIIYYYLY